MTAKKAAAAEPEEGTEAQSAPAPTYESIEFPTTVLPVEKLEGGQIHRAILAVVRSMPTISKDGTLELGGKPIPFQRVDDIKRGLNPILAAYGLVSYPLLLEKEHTLQTASEPMTMAQKYPEGHALAGLISTEGREIRDGKIPTTRSWALVEYAVRFVYVGDNSEVTVTAAGEAYDTNSDKATGKATTAALKRIIVETFKVIDKTEGDEEEKDVDAGNRAATTDRRAPEGADRGTQQRAAASTSGGGRPQRDAAPAGPTRSVTTDPRAAIKAAEEAHADPSTGEVAEPQGDDVTPAAAPDLDRMGLAKQRIRNAVKTLGYQPPQVNQVGVELGLGERTAWIGQVTKVEKVAGELEERVAALADTGSGVES